MGWEPAWTVQEMVCRESAPKIFPIALSAIKTARNFSFCLVRSPNCLSWSYFHFVLNGRPNLHGRKRCKSRRRGHHWYLVPPFNIYTRRVALSSFQYSSDLYFRICCSDSMGGIPQ